MKNKINHLIIVVLALMLQGCDRYTEPNFVPEFPWLTVDQFEMAVIVPYSVGQGGWSDNMGIVSFYEMLATDISSVVNQAAPNCEWPAFVARAHRQWDHSSLNWISGTYPNIFRAIAGCNEGISFLERDDWQNLFPQDNKEKIDANIPRAKSELYFWRAMAYYWATLLFYPPYNQSGANDDRVLPLKITNADPQNTPIGSTQEVIDQMIADLKEAKSLMPTTYYKSGRINYWTICGLLARIYFYTGDFANAEKECTEIINHYGPLGLPADPLAVWTVSIGQQEPTNEAIWMHNANTYDHQGWSWTVVGRASPWDASGGRGENSQITWCACKLSKSIIKKIGYMVDPENGDFTETDFARADKRYGRHGHARDNKVTWWRVEPYKSSADVKAEIEATQDATLYDKYQQHHDQEVDPMIYVDKYYRTPTGSFQNQPLMRVPEFYIMRAAIRNKNNDKSGAAADLKVVRDRAGLTGQYEITAATITEDEIINELIREMTGESLYMLFTVALQRPIFPGDRKGVENVNPPYTGWYWKIPVNEVNTNAGYIGLPDPNSK